MKKLALMLLLTLVSFISCRAADEPHLRTRYVLRSGDELELNYRLTPELNQVVSVQPDGFVNLNLVGDLKISGLTVQEAHDQILNHAKLRLNTPELNLILKEYDKPYFVVSGEVEHPGRFDMRDNTTALQAVLLAGGFKASGYDTNVYLFRRINGENAEVRKLNLHDVVKTRDLERDLMLQPGDMLLIPRNKTERIARFVKTASLGLYFDPLQLR